MLKCVRCNEDVHCERAAVEAATESPVGGLCEDCERSAFGIVLADERWHQSDGCALCPRDGTYALPVIEMFIERTDQTDAYEYDHQAGPFLCDRHFHRLVEVPLAPSKLTSTDSPATT